MSLANATLAGDTAKVAAPARGEMLTGASTLAVLQGLAAPLPDSRARFLQDGFDRLEVAATLLSHAAECAAASVAAIAARGDRIDRLVTDNRLRLEALVGHTAE